MVAPAQFSASPATAFEPESERRAKADNPTPSPSRHHAATNVLYPAFSATIDGAAVIWDVGCGEGRGTAQLVGPERQVVGIDSDKELLARARRGVPQALFCEVLPVEGAPDAVVIVDALGGAMDPSALLMELAARARPGAVLLLAEPRAYLGQQLRAPRVRAFSDADVVELLLCSGWTNVEVHAVAHTFVVVSAKAEPALASTLANLGEQPEQQLRPWLDGAEPQLKAQLRVVVAQSALKASDGDRATAHYLAALEGTPELASASSGLAFLMASCGNYAEAVHFTARCLEAHPTHVPALRLWLHLAGSSQPEERLRTAQALADLCPSDAEVQATLAQLHSELGRPQLAIQDLELLRQYQTEPNVDLSVTLAWLLDSVGRRADACVEARLAAALAPDAPEVADLLNTLHGVT